MAYADLNWGNYVTGAKQDNYEANNTNIVHSSVIRNTMLLSIIEKKGFNDLRYTVIWDAHILIWDAGTILQYIIKDHEIIVIYVHVRWVLEGGKGNDFRLTETLK